MTKNRREFVQATGYSARGATLAANLPASAQPVTAAAPGAAFDMEGLAVTGFTLAEGNGGPPKFPPTLVMNDHIAGYLGAAGVLAALRRRAKEGGSYHVRVSLARAAMWYASLGQFPTKSFDANDPLHRMIEPEPMKAQTPYGLVQRLGPQVKLSKTPGKWRTPLVAVRGADLPVWERGAMAHAIRGHAERTHGITRRTIEAAALASLLAFTSLPTTAAAEYPDLHLGTLGVFGDLKDDAAARTSFFRRPTVLQPWFDWKSNLRREHGLSIGGYWGVLWQNYSDSLINQSNSVGSKFALNLSYDLLNRNQPDALSFDMAIEDRRPLGTDLAPLQAGLGTGSIVPTATTWGDFNFGITQAYVRQSLDNNRFQYTVGKVFAPNFIDSYPFFDDGRQYLNQAFSTSPTINSPGRGFGAVAAWFPGESGLYVMPGMFTTNSSDTGSTIDDFFTKNEHFYMLEVGISGLAQKGTPIQARGPSDTNNVHLTGWYRNANEKGPRAYGVVFNANQTLGDSIMWFVRGGWSEGWVTDRAVSVGLGWRPPSTSDLLGVGVGWQRPATPGVRSQYVSEVFYRFQVTPNFAISPDVQLIIDPAKNPTTDTLWVFGLRSRIAF